ADGLARKDDAVDIYHGFLARVDNELIGACNTGAVEQRKQGQLLGIRGGLHQPEFTKPRKFLAAWRRCIHRKTACGKAIDIGSADSAEITGAEKNCDFVIIFRRLNGGMKAQAGKAKVSRDGLIECILAIVEEIA